MYPPCDRVMEGVTVPVVEGESVRKRGLLRSNAEGVNAAGEEEEESGLIRNRVPGVSGLLEEEGGTGGGSRGLLAKLDDPENTRDEIETDGIHHYM